MTPLAMLLYPVAGAMAFRFLPLVQAIPTSILIGFLLLPARVEWDLPLLPALTKISTPIFVTLALAMLFQPREKAFPSRIDAASRPATAPSTILPGWLPRSYWAIALVGMMLLGPLMTVAFNREVLVFGPVVLPALRLYDAANMALISLASLLALMMGRRFLSGEEGHRALLVVLLTAGLLYSLPTLVEVRLSPQLHRIVYGYFPHDWLQHLRGDGYRPLVFLSHGLVLSMFLCTSALAIVAYLRAIDGDRRVLYFVGAAYMIVVLLLSKSLGMMLVAMMLTPVVLFTGARTQMMVAAGVALLVVGYPLLRVAGISPFSLVADFVANIEPQRADSLRFRLDMEDDLIARMFDKPLFGWGSWGRPQIWNELGQKLDVRDGLWIIMIGERGMVGFFALFGLLCMPVVLLAARARAYGLTLATSGLCVVLAANLIDLIPNAGATPYTFLIAGALLGRLELGRAATAGEQPAAAQSVPPAFGERIYARSEPRPEAVADPATRTAAATSRTPRRATGLLRSRQADSTALQRQSRGEAALAAAADRGATTEAPDKTAPETSTGYTRFPLRPSPREGRS